MSGNGRTIYIAGAGIAGLTLALALAKFGATVVVLERNKAVQEVGAGLQISPNARKALNQLGLDPVTGAIQGQREWGAISLSRENLLPFLYKLHYSLHIPEIWSIDRWGVWLLGVVAAIHWEALKIWLKGEKIRTRPVKLTCPVLYVFGERKPFMFHSPRWLHTLRASEDGAAHALRCGHWVMLEQPEAFHSLVLRWLAGRERRKSHRSAQELQVLRAK